MDSPHTHHSELELVAEYPGVLTIRAWKNIGLCTWSGAAVAPVVATLVEATEKLRSPGRRVSFVHLIPDKLALPDAEARSAFIRLMKDYQSDLACIAIVVGGTGFWASAMRNAIIGLRVFAPRSFEFRLHGSVEESSSGCLPPIENSPTSRSLLRHSNACSRKRWGRSRAWISASPPGSCAPGRPWRRDPSVRIAFDRSCLTLAVQGACVVRRATR